MSFRLVPKSVTLNDLERRNDDFALFQRIRVASGRTRKSSLSLSHLLMSSCDFYLRQGGDVFVVVCLLATLRKNFRTDLHEIFREGWQCAKEQMFKFRWRSRSPYSSLLGDTECG